MRFQSATRCQLDILSSTQRRVLQRDVLSGFQRQGLSRLLFAPQRQRVRVGLNRALCYRIAEAEFTVRRQRDIAAACAQIADVNAHAFLTGHQLDAVGVHATQCARIQRDFHITASHTAVRRLCRHLARRINLIGP